ncbi:PorP/SprF family type IX secretion system membrane protein [Persicobacter psychrovividus]|uniref:Membrane protein n=1 Tax=Persicobacter psychrovividus TaxID=387638 RepID=A0ABN6LAK2_9BACT|nr:membrane protein [Persicobacter psychrovividus]
MRFNVNFFSILLIGVFGVIIQGFAQQAPMYSQAPFVPLSFNPAYSGVEGYTRATLLHRSQWLGNTSSFDGRAGLNTQLFTLDAPVYRIRSGVGLVIENSNLPAVNDLSIRASYAYHLRIKESKLSFGLNVGMYSRSFDNDVWRTIVDEDWAATGQVSQIRPDMSLGIFFQSQKFYGGMSYNHLMDVEFDFGTSDLRDAAPQTLDLFAGYDYEFNYDLIITPSIFMRTDFANYAMELAVRGTYKEKMWGGMNFRWSESVGLMMGYSLLKDNTLKLGYAFDYVVFGQAAKASTSHEFMISYALPMSGNINKKIVRTPRFRH